MYVLFRFVSFAINPIISLDDGKGITRCMSTAPPNTNKERTRGISLFASKVFFFEGVSPRLRLIDVIPISEPSMACFLTE